MTTTNNKMNATSNDNTMTNNATEPARQLYRKFILNQFALNVPEGGLRMDEDDMDEFTNRIFTIGIAGMYIFIRIRIFLDVIPVFAMFINLFFYLNQLGYVCVTSLKIYFEIIEI